MVKRFRFGFLIRVSDPDARNKSAACKYGLGKLLFVRDDRGGCFLLRTSSSTRLGRARGTGARPPFDREQIDRTCALYTALTLHAFFRAFRAHARGDAAQCPERTVAHTACIHRLPEPASLGRHAARNKIAPGVPRSQRSRQIVDERRDLTNATRRPRRGRLGYLEPPPRDPLTWEHSPPRSSRRRATKTPCTSRPCAACRTGGDAGVLVSRER